MKNRFERLLKPRSVVVAGGQWAETVITQCRKAGFDGDIWPLHPTRQELAGERCYQRVEQLPAVPDACFIGINKEGSIELVAQLASMGAGGAVCFASGFGEAAGQDSEAESRQRRLVEAAGQMPLIGPNCYGLINYLDKVALWPDQHGGKPVDRGVAIITQSSNIAINLSMQKRGLPLACLIAAGNQAQTSIAELAACVLEDDRVTALGLHIEGFSDIRAFESLAARALVLGKRIVVIKTGVTPLARAALLSHTRSLSGNDAAASAFLDRLGMLRVRGIGEFIETLKVVSMPRKVSGSRVLSMSCSGGEAALVSDIGSVTGLQFPLLSKEQEQSLRQVLGDGLSLANPLDYHTTIWNDPAAMKSMVRSMLQIGQAPAGPAGLRDDRRGSVGDIALLVLDFPRSDRCDASSWQLALESFVDVVEDWPGLAVVLSTLPENMPESVVESLHKRNVVALCGVADGLRALFNAAWLEQAGAARPSMPVWLPSDQDVSFSVAIAKVAAMPEIGQGGSSARRASQQAWGLSQDDAIAQPGLRQLDESTAKRWLNRFGVRVPVNLRLSFADVRSSRRLSRALDKGGQVFNYPVVAKGLGVVHKSESNAIAMDIHNRRDLERAIRQIDCAGGCLVEEQIQDPVAELLVSVICDPVHGLLMTIGAGGIATEVLNDSVQCLIPASREELERRVRRLRCSPLLDGFRNRPAVNRDRLLDALESVQQAALQLGDRLVELEINPLLCCAEQCTAVDAYVAVVENG